MAALVHDRSRSDGAEAGPSQGDDARRLRDMGPVFAMIVVVGLILAGGPVVETVASLAADPPAGKQTVVEGRAHVVQPGETYWSIAAAVGGEGDIRARVDALEAANGGRSLRAGDHLSVPLLD
ncbi:MAG TPA: LysM domain-containing protein [Acidimicrobiales bacterium]|nr:LysM domain-containing protein [Acidimicrobiales bacterium]